MSQQAVAYQDEDHLMPAREFRRELGDVSGVTLWRWERDGVIPPAVRIKNRKYWLRSVAQKIKRGYSA